MYRYSEPAAVAEHVVDFMDALQIKRAVLAVALATTTPWWRLIAPERRSAGAISATRQTSLSNLSSGSCLLTLMVATALLAGHPRAIPPQR
ncbi:hypothetical protein CA260_07300 [Dyella jiangningensis]|uniref:Uncharacterized protein n=1 Tax=Dyella jiangningensis TaxID=1379159 RepID=A0A328P8Q1_9GAMM|nr:hypothetical protein CA260_07300 [Dyella jiangningensis]